jgi:hypothetical protein
MLFVLDPELSNLIISILYRLHVLMFQVLEHHLLHQSIIISQDSKLSLRDIKFINKLAAFLGDLGVY